MKQGRGLSVLLLILVLMGLLAIPAQAADGTVSAVQHPRLGKILVGSNGMTLYMFTRDDNGVSNCYDACAVNWPPLVVANGEQLISPAGLPGELGTAARKDGTLQVTYDGMPLYYWIRDKAPGDTTGQNVNGIWFVVNTEAATSAAPMVRQKAHPTMGTILTGADGMTLYVFTKDTIGMSNCYNACSTNWPPLLLGAGQELSGAAGLGGQLGTTTRTDGSIQVTYNGMPLYYWIRDKAAGETTGHLVGGIWFVAHPGQLLDVAGHWSEAQVGAAVRTGWVTGHADGSFKPGGQVTGAELAQMLAGAFGPQAEGAAGQGELNRALTRGEAAAMIVRALGQEAEAAQAAAGVERFADGSQVAASFRGFLGHAVAKGIITGYEDNTLRGGGLVTRAEAVVMIQRALSSK